MGVYPAIVRAAIRVSIGHRTTEDDIALFLAAWENIKWTLARAA